MTLTSIILIGLLSGVVFIGVAIVVVFDANTHADEADMGEDLVVAGALADARAEIISLREALKGRDIQGFRFNSESDLCLQEQSDKFYLELAGKVALPSSCNLSISCLRALRQSLRELSFLPIGHARRMVENVASPAAARFAFLAFEILDGTTPNRVFTDDNDGMPSGGHTRGVAGRSPNGEIS